MLNFVIWSIHIQSWEKTLMTKITQVHNQWFKSRENLKFHNTEKKLFNYSCELLSISPPSLHPPPQRHVWSERLPWGGDAAHGRADVWRPFLTVVQSPGQGERTPFVCILKLLCHTSNRPHPCSIPSLLLHTDFNQSNNSSALQYFVCQYILYQISSLKYITL